MSFNIVDIKVVTDYTDFSNAVQFQLNVPVAETDAATLVKSLAAGPWSDIESAITKAVQASAPTPIQTLVAELIKAYAGTPPAAPTPSPSPSPAPKPEEPAT
jgi:hypothetical protein